MSSVRTWERKESDLDLFIESQEFAVHILKITRNEKVFKPEFKTELTDRIVKLSTDIYLNLWKANKSTSKKRIMEVKRIYESTNKNQTNTTRVYIT